MKVLQTAWELFARQGYHATGLNQIPAEAGAAKGALYFHFPGGKQQLAAEAVYAGWLASISDYLLRQGLTPQTADELALFALSSLEGALMPAQTRRDASVVRQVAERVGRAIEQEVPA